MVMLHGLTAGRVATRASRDIDLLANLLASSGAAASTHRGRPASPRGVGIVAHQRQAGAAAS